MLLKYLVKSLSQQRPTT